MTSDIARTTLAVCLVLIAGCDRRAVPATTSESDVTPPATRTERAPATETGEITGTVAETMNSGGYTYLRVDDGSRSVWAAAPATVVTVGDKVSVPVGVAMHNFTSKTLGRTFGVVYFISSFERVGGAAPEKQVASVHGAIGKRDEAPAVDTSHITKAQGGYTIAELFGNKASLAGKQIAVRGKVARFSTAVMGKNWIHLRDGTGAAGSDDLTVTTDAVADIGNTVLVRGTLTTNKNLGYGYKYEVIIEDAQVTIE